MAVNLICFMEIVFADDFNCCKHFSLNVGNETLHAEVHQCQRELHKSGKANQVSFDHAKESKHILALNGGDGCNFKLLGVPFDHALSMRDAVMELVSEAGWQMASILRSGRLFTDCEFVNFIQ